MTADQYAQFIGLALELVAKIIDEVRGSGTKTDVQDIFTKMVALHTGVDSDQAAERAELHKKFDTEAP